MRPQWTSRSSRTPCTFLAALPGLGTQSQAPRIPSLPSRTEATFLPRVQLPPRGSAGIPAKRWPCGRGLPHQRVPLSPQHRLHFQTLFLLLRAPQAWPPLTAQQALVL